MGIVNSLFCKHEWEVLTEKTIDPLIVTLANTGLKSARGGVWEMYQTTYIAVIVCKKCGKLKEVKKST